ncbi:DegT/DnrJ/EryC1/StrS family aminotransferase [Actinocrispum wychmicini]|uniref:Perosamine synthetase n=1 Tax=Actinocrispum wychmicini TaxID=1213861 RepID=A0A4R2JUY3_9PSEU|nr:DegT/DnrJ/EryC1/StrS family aminotransferase [Actinocrispum wychmicini]TCO61148.1 perosamine synthetase [Actinocrispum wychmicini]
MVSVRAKPFPVWPQLGHEEAAAATRVILANELSQNSAHHVAEFESTFAAYHGVPHAVAVNTGTSAIHVALAALGVGPGDEVLVPAYTFVGSATPITYLGARPVFVDVDLGTYCMDPVDAESKVTNRTRAIIAVHLNGHPAPLVELRKMTHRFDLALVEDAAQAHGARCDERLVGTIGDVGCFSFWHDKTMTTGGEGGMVLTHSAELSRRMRSLRDHGMRPAGQPGLYHHAELGFNYRLTSIQAAIGTVQVGKLDAYVAARQANADWLTRALAEVPDVAAPRTASNCRPAPWKYVCRLGTDTVSLDAAAFVTALRDEGIPAQRRYPIPLTHQPIFANPATPHCPRADLCARTAFSLPVHPAVSQEDLQDCVTAITKVRASLLGTGS